MDFVVRKLVKEEISYIYQTYMTQDFPPQELKPLGHILKSMERGYGFALGIYKGADLMGYAVLIVTAKSALLDYFAIVKAYRGKGVGHEAFRLLQNYFEEQLPGINGIYIEAEQIDKAKDEKGRTIRRRRIAFYQSCGCEMTALESKLFGVEYSILYRQLGSTPVQPSFEAVDMIYRTMFKKTHYQCFVKLVDTLPVKAEEERAEE